MAEKTFTMEVTMEERWIPHYMSMMKEMERLGKLGSTRTIGICADGDGDFRPTFKSDVEYEKMEPAKVTALGTVYDAG